MHRMAHWLTTGERPALPVYVSPFARSASGSSSEEDDDDDDDDDEEDDEDDDPDAEKSDEELRAELKATRASLAKANGQSAKRRKALRQREAELEEARKPKPKKKADGDEDDGPDLDTVRHEAKSEGLKEGLARAKKAEAKSALLAAGVNPERVTKAVGLLDLEELDLDDEGLDGIEDEIEKLRTGWPEMFARKRIKRESVAGDRDAGGDRPRSKPKSASERAADQLLGRKSA